jgi:FixJ family two-component response regulator
MTVEAPLLAVVDDDPDVRVALSRLISSAGFAVESFASGAAFLQSIEDHEPDCVLLDVHLPDASGFEIQGALAVEHGTVPIIIITGHHSPETRARALDLGAKGYLCKPVDDEVLLSAIGAAIAGRTMHPGRFRS